MKIYLIFISLIVLFFTSCNTKPNENEFVVIEKDFNYINQDSKLLQRILDYWYLRSMHKFEESYEYELPYQTYLKTFERYADEGATTYRKFRVAITKIEYKNEKSIALVYRKYYRKNTELNLSSKWIKIENKWYHKYDYTVFPEGR